MGRQFPKLRGIKSRFAMAALSLAACVAALEGVLAFFRSSWDVPPERISATQNDLYRTLFRFDPLLGHIGHPHKRVPQFRQQHNRYGFRGQDWPVEKPSQEFRIGIFGDSQTWGWTLSDTQTIAYFLQNRGVAVGGKKIRVLNLGIPGYSVDQEFILFLTTHKWLKLDAVITVAFLANDMFEVGSPNYWGMPRPPSRIQNNQLVLGKTMSPPAVTWARLPLSIPLTEVFGPSPSISRLLTYQFFGHRTVPLREGLKWCSRLVEDGYCAMFSPLERERAVEEWFPYAVAVPSTASPAVQLFSAYVSAFKELTDQLGIPFGLVLVPGMKHGSGYDARLVDKVRRALPPLKYVIDIGEVLIRDGRDIESFNLDGYHYNAGLNLLVADQLRQVFGLVPDQ